MCKVRDTSIQKSEVNQVEDDVNFSKELRGSML